MLIVEFIGSDVYTLICPFPSPTESWVHLLITSPAVMGSVIDHFPSSYGFIYWSLPQQSWVHLLITSPAVMTSFIDHFPAVMSSVVDHFPSRHEDRYWSSPANEERLHKFLGKRHWVHGRSRAAKEEEIVPRKISRWCFWNKESSRMKLLLCCWYLRQNIAHFEEM